MKNSVRACLCVCVCVYSSRKENKRVNHNTRICVAFKMQQIKI